MSDNSAPTPGVRLCDYRPHGTHYACARCGDKRRRVVVRLCGARQVCIYRGPAVRQFAQGAFHCREQHGLTLFRCEKFGVPVTLWPVTQDTIDTIQDPRHDLHVEGYTGRNCAECMEARQWQPSPAG